MLSGSAREPFEESGDRCGQVRARCTDFVCGLLLAAALAVSGSLAGLAWSQGNLAALERYAYGRDFHGRLCGVDSEVRHYPLTFFTVAAGHAPVGNQSGAQLRRQLSPVCTSRCPRAEAGAKSRNVTARDPSLCPASDPALCAWYGGNATELGYYCLDPGVFDSEVTERASKWMQDIRACRWNLFVMPPLAIAVGFLFLLLVHRCGHVCVWTLPLLVTAAPVVFGGLAMYQAQLQEHGHAPLRLSASVLTSHDLRVVSYCLFALGAVFGVLLVCLAGTIRNVVSVLKVSSEFLTHVPAHMLQPFFFGLLQTVVVFTYIAIIVATASMGLQEGDQRTCLAVGDIYCLHWDTESQRYALAFLLFALYWVVNFLHALSHYCTAYAVGSWYCTTDVDLASGQRRLEGGGLTLCDCRLCSSAMCAGLVKHSGSLAFGAGVITIAKILRILTWWVAHKEEQQDMNPVTRCTRRVANTIAYCFTNFLQFVSEHAFTEIALTGLAFCPAAQRALAMSVMHPAMSALVRRVSGAVRVFGVVFIVVGTGAAYALLLVLAPPQGVTSLLAPVLVAGAVAFVIGAGIMQPFTTVAEAAWHCYCLETHRAQEVGSDMLRSTPRCVAHLASSEPHSESRCCGCCG